MIKFIQFSLLFVVSIFSLQAQNLDPVKWSSELTENSDNTLELKFTAAIEEGWTVYSMFTADDGPRPTELNFEDPVPVEKLGKAIETGHRKEGLDKLFDVEVIKFLDDLDYTVAQKLKVIDYDTPIVGYLTFMTCDNKRCLPPKDIEFTFDLKKFKKQPADPVKKEIEVAAVAKEATPQKITINTASSSDNIKIINTPEPPKAEEQKIFDPVSWDIVTRKLSGNEYELVYTANIEKGWTVYSQFVEEGGPVPTTIEYLEADHIELLGEATESGKSKAGFDKIFEMDVVKFLADEPFQIVQKFKTDQADKPVVGYLTYMTCDASRCLPPKDVDFSIMADPSISTANISGNGSELTASDFANIEGNTIDQIIPSLRNSYEKPLTDCGTVVKKGTGFLSLFGFGFIGGLVAILLPCIFPMIPITVSFFSKDTKRKGWVNGLIYGLSIIVIFVSIGLAMTAAFGPEILNLISTHWLANTLFFLIFVAFALSFFGYYEIALPSSWSTKTDRMADQGGLMGTFFMAATLAIVSFSCTGPIIGTALVQVASEGSYIGPFAVMLGFSTALALPFGLFAAFPAWLNSLPQSGGWMTNVKVVLGFLELALALKFLSIADLTSHWGFLKYELFLGLWVLIFAAMTLYLFGYIRFPHDSKVKKLGPVRTGFAIVSLLTTLYLMSGFTVDKEINSYNAPALTSGLAPPAMYNFFLTPSKVDDEIKAKFPSYGKCANNINCFKDYYEGMAYANETNKPVMIDFTGHGCVNCRNTEQFIWIEDNIRRLLNNEYVLISLYVDDRKKLPETLLSKNVENKKLRNVGNKWTDFQVVNFEQNSQPLYVLVTPDQEVIAHPRGYDKDADQYEAFLECGLNHFKETN